MDYTLLNLYLVACLIFFLVLMWVQHNRRTVMLFSTRNIFLVGFAYFQIISVMYWAADPGRYGKAWHLARPKQDATHFVAMSLLFILCYLITYHLFRFVAKHRRSFTFRSGAEGDMFLLLLALIMSVLSVGMQIGIGNRYIAIMSQYAGVGMGAAGCGLAAWVLVVKYKNPIVFSYCAGIIAMNMLGQFGSFGRRGLLSMGLAILWSVFYRYLHPKRIGYLAIAFVIMFLPSFLLISGFTATRQFHTEMSKRETVGLLSVDALKQGVQRLVGPTDTGPISLWLIENYPENFRHRHMFTPLYTFGHFIPRVWWKNKPTTLSHLAVKQARLTRVGSLNVGAGIIGHAAAEGGYYAIVVYALLGAMLTKFLDEVAKYNKFNVYVIVPIGAALAEIVSSARGETSFMLGVGGTGMVCVFLFMLTVAQLTGSRLPSQAVLRQRYKWLLYQTYKRR